MGTLVATLAIMPFRTPSFALAFALGLLAQGCSSPAAAPVSTTDAGKNKAAAKDGGPAEAEDAAVIAPPADYVDAATPDLQILPDKSFSGFDGMHKFQVPIAVYGGGADLKLTASNPAAVEITPTTLTNPSGDDAKWFLVVVKAAGAITLTAASNGKSIESKLTIATYSAAEYTSGETRYMNGVSAEPSCISCHAEGTGIDHSPATMASATDGDVRRVVLSGLRVAGNPITSVNHKWTLTEDEKVGIVPYLRALPPRGFQGAK